MWTRRDFLRTGSLAVVGGIFVPKYERWFRPLIVPVRHFVRLSGPGGYMRQAVYFNAGDTAEIRFPIQTEQFIAERAEIVDQNGRNIVEVQLASTKLLLPNDQAILRIPRSSLDPYLFSHIQALKGV